MDSNRFNKCKPVANKIIAKVFNTFADNLNNENITVEEKRKKFIELAKSEVRKNMMFLKRKEKELTAIC